MADWFKRFEGAMGEVGRGLQQVADEAIRVAGEAGKVAGIGVGTVELELARARWSGGDDVRGVVRLKLTEPTEARRIAVTVKATRERYSMERRNGNRVRVRRTETLYEHTTELAADGTYQTESFAFEVPLPVALEERLEADGVVGDVLNLAQGLRSLSESPVSWKLTAVVDLPWKRNVTQTRDLVVD